MSGSLDVCARPSSGKRDRDAARPPCCWRLIPLAWCAAMMGGTEESGEAIECVAWSSRAPMRQEGIDKHTPYFG